MEKPNLSGIKKIAYASAFLMLLTAVFFTGLFMTPPAQRYNDDAFNETFNNILRNHFSAPTEEQLWEGAIYGLINSLDDPFSRYFDAETFNRFREGFGESYVGIGVTVENFNEQVLIRYVWPDSPAQRAGLTAGDIIVYVDGEDFSNKSFAETTAALLGEENTEVTIGFKRVDINEIIYVTITREKIANPSVEAEIFEVDDYKIGYLVINTFGDETANNVALYMDTFSESGIDGLIIDLRDNGGGGLNALLDILDLFLSKDAQDFPLFSIELRNAQNNIENYYPNTNVSFDFDITVLINGQSASASEVFSAAMQEYGEYQVIGEASYGKGTLQSSIALSSIRGNYVHLTIGVWKTALGNWVDRNGGTNGVQPNIEVTQNPALFLPPIYLSDDEFYQFDQVSNRIKIAQDILNTLGYTVRNDGYFDLNTQDKITEFQIDQGLDESGRLNSQTASALSEALFNYKQNPLNDTQLQEAILYLIGGLND
jgi:carboxyl-terminal processing protease